jgi:hypothetical protein
MRDEIMALGAAYRLTAGQIRWRLLVLERQVREALERWPTAYPATRFSGFGKPRS